MNFVKQPLAGVDISGGVPARGLDERPYGGRKWPEGPLISIVIPHLNQPEALEVCLSSLDTQSLARDFFETIVVDNGSVSIPEDIVANHPGTRLLRELQAGPGPARNFGVRSAKGDIIAFIDADCRAHRDWLRNALQTIRSSPEGTILGGDVRIWRNRGNTFTGIEAFEAVFEYRFKFFIERHGYCGTGNLVVRRSDFEKVGPFAGIEFAEDVEWGQRARAAGLAFRYIPEMVVFHPARRSLQELYAKWDRHTQHELNMARGKHGWKIRWIARALAVLASPIVHSMKVLGSDRIQGVSARLKAISVLFAIRAYRARKMLNLLSGSNVVVWNRGAAMLTNSWHGAGPLLPGAHAEPSESKQAAPLAFQSAAFPTPVTSFALPDDLSREVYCILGLPFDSIGMHEVLRRIESAVAGQTPLLIATPNLNSLVISELDRDYREPLLLSDLCTADGMPIIWIAWLIGIPIKNRIAGSDIFDALKAEHSTAHPLKIFLLGGPEGVARMASQALNSQPSGLYCVGWLYPGFGSVEEMSRDDIIDNINSSGADFLVASLGNQKGHLWLLRNHHRLLIPVRAHLGATLNFQAGTVRRAPLIMRKFGLEWLWRIKEEPYLWRRYWNDGRVLLRLLFTHVLPFAFWTWWLRLRYERRENLIITQAHGRETVTLSLSGTANARHVDKAISAFREAIATRKQVTLDFSNTRTIDARFLGLLLMLKKKLKNAGAAPNFVGLSPYLEKIFRLNGLDFK